MAYQNAGHEQNNTYTKYKI